MELQIPMVNEDDLKIFHENHYKGMPRPKCFWPNTGDHVIDDSESGLGYYQDGVMRTLTNEEIAIFRHSEIQALLKEIRITGNLSSFDLSNVDESPTPLVPQLASATRTPSPKAEHTHQAPKPQIETQKKKSKKKSNKRKAAQRYSEQVKRQKRNTSSPLDEEETERHDPADYISDDEGRTYRRKAREEDEVMAPNVELDY